MSAMRLCALAVLVAASLVAAAIPRTAGCGTASNDNSLYVNSTISCAQATACTTKYTACLAARTAYNCTAAIECIAARFACLNTAADNTTGCVGLNNVKTSLLKVAAGTLYNASTAYQSCVRTACIWLNSTYSGEGTNCTIDNTKLCTSPIVFIATLVFKGNFTAILADETKRAKFAAAIGTDVSNALNIFGCIVHRMFISGSKRQASQSLVVEVEIPGVSEKNADFKASFAALQANPGKFLTSSNAVYKAETGANMEVLGVGAGTSSNAFSGGLPGATTATPATPKPSTGTPATGTPATPKPPTTTKKHGSSSTGSETSGAVSQSLLAAAVVVVAAMLF